MKKIYTAPSTFSIELRATKMMALSLDKDKTIDSGNVGEYDQDAREDNFNTNSNGGNIWDNAW